MKKESESEDLKSFQPFIPSSSPPLFIPSPAISPCLAPYHSLSLAIVLSSPFTTILLMQCVSEESRVGPFSLQSEDGEIVLIAPSTSARSLSACFLYTD